jgi:uncharacterized membrane protein YsdA (DUF1294 family)/cold shock CspA family protein
MTREFPLKIPSAQQRGVVVKFDAERGFGFIRPDDAAGAADRDVFVHVRNVPGRRALHPGQRVAYHLARTDRGLAAVNVQVETGLLSGLARSLYARFILIGLGSALLLLFGLAAALDRPTSLALWLAMWVVAMSAATYGIYRYDKAMAEARKARVPEAVLHLLSALGGSPGAFAGMRWPTRHKTGKPLFQAIFWLIVAVQLGAAIFWIVSESGL